MPNSAIRLYVPNYFYKVGLERMLKVRLEGMALPSQVNHALGSELSGADGFIAGIEALHSGEIDALACSGRHLPLKLPAGLNIAGALFGSSRNMAVTGEASHPDFFYCSDLTGTIAYQNAFPSAIRLGGYNHAPQAGTGVAVHRLLSQSELDLTGVSESQYRLLDWLVPHPGAGLWVLLTLRRRVEKKWPLLAISDPLALLVLKMERRIARYLEKKHRLYSGVQLIPDAKGNRMNLRVCIPSSDQNKSFHYSTSIPFQHADKWVEKALEEMEVMGVHRHTRRAFVHYS
jgi:porphobilinogen deaminase